MRITMIQGLSSDRETFLGDKTYDVDDAKGQSFIRGGVARAATAGELPKHPMISEGESEPEKKPAAGKK
jgi:hypothetical protein